MLYAGKTKRGRGVHAGQADGVWGKSKGKIIGRWRMGLKDRMIDAIKVAKADQHLNRLWR